MWWIIPLIIFSPLPLGLFLIFQGMERKEKRSDSSYRKVVREERLEFLVPGWIILTIETIIIVITLSLWLSFATSSFTDVQRLSAFQKDTFSAYQYTIDATEKVVIDVTQTRRGSFTDFAYEEQGKTVSQRIMELRDKIEGYNKTLKRLQEVNKIPIIGSMFYDVPDDLKPIRMESFR